MRTVHKFKLAIISEQELEIPGFVSFLKVAEQHSILTIWALVDTERTDIDTRVIHILGTGGAVKVRSKITPETYIGSVLMSNGLVWPIFTTY